MALWRWGQLSSHALVNSKSSGSLLKPHLRQLLPCQWAQQCLSLSRLVSVWTSARPLSHCTVKPEGRDHIFPSQGLHSDRRWAGKDDVKAQKRSHANTLSKFSAKRQCRDTLATSLPGPPARTLGPKRRAQCLPNPGKKCLRPTQMTGLPFPDTGGLAQGCQG